MQQPQSPQQTSWAPAPTAGGSFLDVRDYANVVRRRWKLIAACIAVAIGLAIVWTSIQSPTYTATTGVLVQQATEFEPPITVANEQATMMSLPVAVLAAPKLGSSDPAALLRHVSVSLPKDGTVLQIRFDDSNPERAAA